jgi:uncharacterized membrane protein YtjA (UPF0391 family)
MRARNEPWGRGVLRPGAEVPMFGWAVTFLVLALIAGYFGFFGLAGLAAAAAEILLLVFLVLLAASGLLGLIRGEPPV